MSLIGAMLATKRAEGLSREKLRELQQRRLRKLVSFARARSPYYRALFAGAGEDFSLADLPVTTKPQMMAAFDRVLTDPAVTMARVEAFTGDLENVGRMLDGKYLVFRTSGSTGNPAVLLYGRR